METDSTGRRGLGRIAARGAIWVSMASGVGLAFSLLAQVALGWLLSEDDFGVYALAVAFSGFFQAVREGGVRLFLIQAGRASFDRLVNNAFWYTLLFATLGGGLLALGSPIAASIFDEPGVKPLLLIVALTLPLGSYAVVAIGKLQVDLRFKTLARLEMAANVVRYSTIVLLAWAGLGPESFVIGAALAVMTQNVIGFATTRLAPWRVLPSRAEIAKLFSHSKWAASGSLATKTLRRADYLGLGLVASTRSVGVYFFAYQLTFRMLNVFSEGLRQVFVPAAARIIRREGEIDEALRRAALLVGMFVVPLPMLLVLLSPNLEHLLWRGRWVDAVPAIQILGGVMAFELYVLLTQYAVMSAGHFRFWTAVTVLRGAGLLLASYGAGLIGRRSDDLTVMTGVIALYLVVSGIATIVATLRRSGAHPGRFLHGSLRPLVFNVSCVVAFLLLLSGPKLSEMDSTLWLSVLLYPLALLLGFRSVLRRQLRDVAPLVSGLPGGRALLTLSGHRQPA